MPKNGVIYTYSYPKLLFWVTFKTQKPSGAKEPTPIFFLLLSKQFVDGAGKFRSGSFVFFYIIWIQKYNYDWKSRTNIFYFFY